MNADDRPSGTVTATPPSRERALSPRSSNRFAPGTVVADRYRVIALLGRGGVAEVFRAEDLRLGQQVALKFLPASVATDHETLERLYQEVRLGRRITHPNVCRLHDIVEWEGHHFIAMEYIDGETLSSLLRRIGRLPHDKALDLARDISEGLGAAHDVGVIHRDLKPANVMVDGRGRARITDFGLAEMAEDLAHVRERSGTPAYMAPEQLEAGIATERSDLYALGLILFEIFTGRRRFDATSYDELVAQHASMTPHALQQDTQHLESDVQRVLIRCLQERPEQRPVSIRAVLAQLPQRDVLQAAIDAGDTPSPEMVAEAGDRGDLAPRHAVGALAVLLVLIVGVMLLAPRASLLAIGQFPRSPHSLADRAQEMIAAIGSFPRRDMAASARYNAAFLEFVSQSDRSVDWWQRLRHLRPGPMEYVYRQSPGLLVPSSIDGRVTSNNPPANLPGMVEVRLDGEGRLIWFSTVTQPSAGVRGEPGAVRWDRFFEFAGLELGLAELTEPIWNADVSSDTRVAWLGAHPESSERVRIEAASHEGRPVAFAVFGSWRTALADRPVDRVLGGTPDNSIPPVALLLRVVTLLVAAVLASMNLRQGRSDRRGAFRTAVAIAAILFAGRLVGLDHVPDFVAELNLILYTALPIALAEGATAWLTYVAMEPYVRRFWPQSLTSWNRVITGRVRDPRVGRDLLFGLIGGLVMNLTLSATVLLPTMFEQPQLTPLIGSASSMGELPQFISAVVMRTSDALRIGVSVMSFLFLFLVTTRSRRVAGVALTMVVAIGITYRGENIPIELAAGLLVGATTLALVTRAGLLSFCAAMFVSLVVQALPLTFDISAWYFGRSALVLTLIAALGAYGCHCALAGRSLFKPILD